MEDWKVVIVGAGPSGLATAACLNKLSIPNVVLEREDCCASLWRKRVYDCLVLHFPKEYCQLPYMPYPCEESNYISKDTFISYIDDYVSHFDVRPKYCRSVEYASYDAVWNKWRISVRNTDSSVNEVYFADCLVVATGENSEPFIPEFSGLETFSGESIHSSAYKSGSEYIGQHVLVVGSGNSGMEIANDLSNHGAHTSIVIKSPVHVLTKEMAHLAMLCLKKLSVSLVDNRIMRRANTHYGDLSQHGLVRPAEGPFYLKATTGKSPIIDVGTVDKIVNGNIKVLPAVSTIEKNSVTFANGETHNFDSLIFATGYRKTTNHWIKDHDSFFDNEGLPKERNGGSNGLYFVGFARMGLACISM